MVNTAVGNEYYFTLIFILSGPTGTQDEPPACRSGLPLGACGNRAQVGGAGKQRSPARSAACPPRPQGMSASRVTGPVKT